MVKRLQCDDCPERFHNKADLRSHQTFVHQSTKITLPCSFKGCKKVYLRYRSLADHNEDEHGIKLPGDEDSRLKCEKKTKIGAWRKVVINNLRERGERASWMKFSVNKLKKRAIYNGVDSILVSWLDFLPAHYDTYEPISNLEEDVPDMLSEFLAAASQDVPIIEGPAFGNRRRPRMGEVEEWVYAKIEKNEPKKEESKPKTENKREIKKNIDKKEEIKDEKPCGRKEILKLSKQLKNSKI